MKPEYDKNVFSLRRAKRDLLLTWQRPGVGAATDTPTTTSWHGGSNQASQLLQHLVISHVPVEQGSFVRVHLRKLVGHSCRLWSHVLLKGLTLTEVVLYYVYVTGLALSYWACFPRAMGKTRKYYHFVLTATEELKVHWKLLSMILLQDQSLQVGYVCSIWVAIVTTYSSAQYSRHEGVPVSVEWGSLGVAPSLPWEPMQHCFAFSVISLPWVLVNCNQFSHPG